MAQEQHHQSDSQSDAGNYHHIAIEPIEYQENPDIKLAYALFDYCEQDPRVELVSPENGYCLMDIIQSWLEDGDGTIRCQTFASYTKFVIFILDAWYANERKDSPTSGLLPGFFDDNDTRKVVRGLLPEGRSAYAGTSHPALNEGNFDLWKGKCLQRQNEELNAKLDQLLTATNTGTSASK